ncbi:MAG: hypothetical protein IPL70_10930 [Uliginosibacterium sp.]|nr:hypothetical protein [Uliginosibacterium sp.]
MLELTPTYAGGDDAPELVGLAGYVEEATGEAGVVDDACLPAGDLAVD